MPQKYSNTICSIYLDMLISQISTEQQRRPLPSVENGDAQESSMGLPCIDHNIKDKMRITANMRGRFSRNSTESSSNLMGSDPRIAPLQLSAAIALSA